jgi:membrane protease YdiL (CAAX protease family)
MTLQRLLGIAGSLAGFRLLRPLTDHLDEADPRRHAAKWVPAVLVAAYVYLVEDRDAASLGVRWDGPRTFLKRVGLGFAAMMGANIVMGPIHERLGTEDLQEGMAAFGDTGLLGKLFIAATAGVTEELLFRGYALERLDELTDSRLVAAVVTTAAFVLGHKGETWGWKSVLQIAQPAVVVTALYLRFRDLLALMTVHALNDAVGLLFAEQISDDD